MSKHSSFFMKSIIWVLVICFIGMLFPMTTPVKAHEMVDNDYGISAVSDSDNPRLDECNVLKYVDDKAFLSNGFVKRITEDEDLNTYVFEREDGSRNLYMFSEDVKFETSDGTVLEKDISLQRNNNGYVTKQNNIGLFLPNNYLDGVRLSFKNNELLLLPLSSSSDIQAINEIDKISYQDAFGHNSNLVFTPTLSGVKQDIVLNDYEGENRFSFVAKSETLKPYTEDFALFFAENYDSEYRFAFGSVYIYDSEGGFTVGEIEVEQLNANSWIITVIAPTDFLESETTVYPVTIDPVILVQAQTASSYIEDTTIHSGLPNTAAGSWGNINTGFISNSAGIARTLVRLPGLTNNATYNSIPSALITSAKFCVYEQTTAGTDTVSLYNYIGTSWTESGATWNNVSYNGYAILFDTETPAGGTLVEFNITNLVKGWKNGTYAFSSGFMLRKQNEGDGVNYHTFYSSESSYSNYRPYVEITYTPIIVNIKNVAINEGESMVLTATVPSGATVTWSNTYLSSNISVDVTGIVRGLKACTSPCTVTATVLYQGYPYSDTCQVYVKIPDGTYYLKNKGSGRYADATGYSNGDEVLRWSFHGANNQRWEISYISNGLYSIKNKISNMYLGVETLNSTSAVTRQYSSLSDSTKWYISKTISGAYCLYAKGNISYGYVIGAASSSTTTIVNMSYSNNSDYKDEWIFVSFGNQPFRTLETWQYDQINCHGYAMMRNDKPYGWTTACDAFVETVIPTEIIGNADYSNAIKEELSDCLKLDFENWLDNNGYTYQFESDFNANGDYKVLKSNQYRIVIRAGLHNIYVGTSIIGHKEFDYHLWYQTFDGRWANKHGAVDLIGPDWLNVGVIPSTSSISGWAYPFIQNNNMYYYTDFYDCAILSYIITL